jgi:hypothetical protein
MNTLSQNIQHAAQTINQIRQQVLAQQAEIFANEPGKRPSIREMQQTVWVNSHQPIGWPNWPPGITAKLTALLKKLIRRSLQWYIDPIVEQQNKFNQVTLQAVEMLAQEVAFLQTRQATTEED